MDLGPYGDARVLLREWVCAAVSHSSAPACMCKGTCVDVQWHMHAHVAQTHMHPCMYTRMHATQPTNHKPCTSYATHTTQHTMEANRPQVGNTQGRAVARVLQGAHVAAIPLSKTLLRTIILHVHSCIAYNRPPLCAGYCGVPQTKALPYCALQLPHWWSHTAPWDLPIKENPA